MKTKILTILILMGLFLSACSGTGAEEDISSSNQESLNKSIGLNVDDTEDQLDDNLGEEETDSVQLSTQIRLILGSMSLDEAGLDLSLEQANALLPLWKVMKNLLGSDTSAAAEIEALLTQIQDELTPEQRNWVENFSLNQEEYQAILAEFIPEDLLNAGSLLTEEEREARRATAIAENGGTVPESMLGSGGGRGMGGGSGIPGSGAGESTGDGTGSRAGAGGGQINTYLIEALIIELESIAAP
jgi:hypothetical protein